jgi:phosphoglucosamine mutase
VGVETRSAGVITTPGVAFLARSQGFDAGVVISASHNPWTDNGIKIFSGDGYKLPDARELAIEKEIFALLQADQLRRRIPRRRLRAFRARKVCARLTFAGWRAAFRPI